jgi:hypothetical protein
MQNAECRMLRAASRITHHASRFTPHAPPTPHSQRGVALVITLILLSVITFMAITFLVLSRNEKGSVTTQTDLTIARLAADSALQRAQAELLAPIMAWTNEYNYGLLVSTNYINSAGFDPGALPVPSPNPTNVNYDYTKSGAALNLDQQLQNLANLLYNPRPPVFIANQTYGSNEFRFFLNLNRNTDIGGNLRFDPSGLLPVIGANGLPITDPPGVVVSNFFVGDPQWIGGLQRPEFSHSATNLFAYRYAYFVVPAGQTLDINNIHNDAKRRDMTKGGDGFLRDQGVLTAEINLAAFLVDLNTNLWPLAQPNLYNFQPYNYDITYPNPVANGGAAFDDAFALLRYRYANTWNNLANVRSLLGSPGATAFSPDLMDGYSAGPLMTGTSWPPPGSIPPAINLTRVTENWPWPGADNPNHFYTTQDLFDQSKTRNPNAGPKTFSFTDRLLMAGTNNDSYNRYTFYRLLSQLGTDSATEPGGKMNLNYCNVDSAGYVVPGMATNFSPWSPVQFFTNAFIRLLADAGYSVGMPASTSNLLVLGTTSVNGKLVATTNLHILIWSNNLNTLYTPSVHRFAQIAANLYDATTNRVLTDYPQLPSVFRPLFVPAGSGQGGSPSAFYLTGYQEVTNTSILLPTQQWRDLDDPTDRLQFRLADMVYGIPLVIGAKKGFPNFNEFAMQTEVQVERKLQFRRDTTNGPIIATNQMFIVGISNVFGVEAWNSYSNSFPRNLQIQVWPDISLVMANEYGIVLNGSPQGVGRFPWPTTTQALAVTNIPANTWRGYDKVSEVTDSYSFRIPLFTNNVFLTNSTYWRGASRSADRFTPLASTFQPLPFYVPQWWLTMKTRIRVAVVDTSVSPNRIVDFVNLAAAQPEPSSCFPVTNFPVMNSLDLTSTLARTTNCTPACLPNAPYSECGDNPCMWCTNRYPSGTEETKLTYGIKNQIGVCLGRIPVGSGTFRRDFPTGTSVSGDDGAIDFFRSQFDGFSPTHGNPRSPNALTFAAPFQPYRNIYLVTSWQANDPLVHYTVGDLKNMGQHDKPIELDYPNSPRVTDNLGKVNFRYEPWGYTANQAGSTANNSIGVREPAAKDPVATTKVASSDDWDFPTNKFPNAGWVGRVHRGTPWQTVYLKAGGVNLSYWTNWTGNGQTNINLGQFGTNVVLMSTAVTTNSPQSTNTVITFTNGLPFYDAYFTQPTNDWRIVDLFTAALSDNATRGQLSVNQTNLAAWSAVLSGVIVLTNIVDNNGNPILVNDYAMLSPLVIQPAGVYNAADPPTAWPPVARLVHRINQFRATNNVRQVFSRLGDLLAVPELTVASPFLNTNTPLSDAAVERIPQQILGLLKADSVPRFVIYSFGQTLKPAPRSLYMGNIGSGRYRGLCTNYQVVAEVVTRAVVRFEGVQPYGRSVPPAITNLHPVIESFNILPSD